MSKRENAKFATERLYLLMLLGSIMTKPTAITRSLEVVMPRRGIYAVIAAVLLVLYIGDTALACEPRDHGAEINLQGSDVVFVGQVLGRTEEPRARGEGGVCTDFKYQFRVTRAWKGVTGQDITVYGVYGCERLVPPTFLDCELNDWGEFKVGQAYLVYASYGVYGDNEKLYAWIGDAGMSKPASEAAEEMRELSALVPTTTQPGMPIAGAIDARWIYATLLAGVICLAGLLLRGCMYRVAGTGKRGPRT